MTPPIPSFTRGPVKSVRLFQPLGDFEFSDGAVTRVRSANAAAFELSQQMAETKNPLLVYEIAAHCALDCSLDALRDYGMDEITTFVQYVSGQLHETLALLAAADAETGSGEAPAETTATASSSATGTRSKRSVIGSLAPTASATGPSISSSPTT